MGCAFFVRIYGQALPDLLMCQPFRLEKQTYSLELFTTRLKVASRITQNFRFKKFFAWPKVRGIGRCADLRLKA